MDRVIGLLSFGSAFYFLVEGVDALLSNKDEKVIYKAIHIAFPLFIIVGDLYFLFSGAIS